MKTPARKRKAAKPMSDEELEQVIYACYLSGNQTVISFGKPGAALKRIAKLARKLAKLGRL